MPDFTVYCYRDKKNPEIRGTIFRTGGKSFAWKVIVTNEVGSVIFSDYYDSLRGAQSQLGKHTPNGVKRTKVIKEGEGNA